MDSDYKLIRGFNASTKFNNNTEYAERTISSQHSQINNNNNELFVPNESNNNKQNLNYYTNIYSNRSNPDISNMLDIFNIEKFSSAQSLNKYLLKILITEDINNLKILSTSIQSKIKSLYIFNIPKQTLIIDSLGALATGLIISIFLSPADATFKFYKKHIDELDASKKLSKRLFLRALFLLYKNQFKFNIFDIHRHKIVKNKLFLNVLIVFTSTFFVNNLVDTYCIINNKNDFFYKLFFITSMFIFSNSYISGGTLNSYFFGNSINNFSVKQLFRNKLLLLVYLFFFAREVLTIFSAFVFPKRLGKAYENIFIRKNKTNIDSTDNVANSCCCNSCVNFMKSNTNRSIVNNINIEDNTIKGNSEVGDSLVLCPQNYKYNGGVNNAYFNIAQFFSPISMQILIYPFHLFATELYKILSHESQFLKVHSKNKDINARNSNTIKTKCVNTNILSNTVKSFSHVTEKLTSLEKISKAYVKSRSLYPYGIGYRFFRMGASSGVGGVTNRYVRNGVKRLLKYEY